MVPAVTIGKGEEPDERLMSVVYDVQRLCQNSRERMAVREPRGRPEWVLSHRAPRAIQIAKEIEDHESHVKSLWNELEPFDRMLDLIDGTGEGLVDAVAQLFNKPEEGITITKTEKRASLDLFVSDGEGRRLAIEVTGVKGYLSKNDPHWSDFLGYLPEHTEKNIAKRVERIVLIVNTQWDTEVEERQRGPDITQPVRELAENNHICVIRSVDLHGHWLKTIEGMGVSEIFDVIFSTEGIYEPKAS